MMFTKKEHGLMALALHCLCVVWKRDTASVYLLQSSLDIQYIQVFTV